MKKLGAFGFWLGIGLTASAVLALFVLPSEAKQFRRAAMIVAYVCGLPATLGIMMVVFEKLGWLKTQQEVSDTAIGAAMQEPERIVLRESYADQPRTTTNERKKA